MCDYWIVLICLNYRPPKRCDPRPLRDPVFRAWLPRARDPAGARSQSVYFLSIHLEIVGFCSTNVVGFGRTQLSDSLAALSNTASSASARAPPELIHQFIDDGRNPDIYTREFIEQIQLLNREMKGKCEAFASFGVMLGAAMTKAMPNLEPDVARILSAGSMGSTKNGNGEAAGP